MELTEEQIKEREQDPNNLVNILHKIIGKGQHHKQTRTKDKPNLTTEDRALIGLTAHIDTVKNTALAFGVSPASVNAYKTGNTSLNKDTRSDESCKELKELVGSRLAKVHDTAVDKLMGALDEMNLENPKAALIYSQIGANVSKIVEKTSPGEKGHQGVKVTILAPNVRPISAYDVIEVSVEN